MFSFPKTRRLQYKKEYERVFSKANKTVMNELVLLHRENHLSYARIGLALSKKMIAKACQRNQVKRIIRESFRICTLPSVDVIVLVKKGFEPVDNKVIHSNLRKAWEKLSAYYAN